MLKIVKFKFKEFAYFFQYKNINNPFEVIGKQKIVLGFKINNK